MNLPVNEQIGNSGDQNQNRVKNSTTVNSQSEICGNMNNNLSPVHKLSMGNENQANSEILLRGNYYLNSNTENLRQNFNQTGGFLNHNYNNFGDAINNFQAHSGLIYHRKSLFNHIPKSDTNVVNNSNYIKNNTNNNYNIIINSQNQKLPQETSAIETGKVNRSLSNNNTNSPFNRNILNQRSQSNDNENNNMNTSNDEQRQQQKNKFDLQNKESSILQEELRTNNTNQFSFNNKLTGNEGMKIRNLNSISQDFYSKLSSESKGGILTKNNYDNINKKAMENCKHIFSNSNKRHRNIANDSNFSIMYNDSTLSRLNIEKLNEKSFLNNNSLTTNQINTTIGNNKVEDTNAHEQSSTHKKQTSVISNQVCSNDYSNINNKQMNLSLNIMNKSGIENNKAITSNLANNQSNSNIFGNRSRRQILNLNSNANTIAINGTDHNLENATERGISSIRVQENNNDIMQTHSSFISNYTSSKPPMNINNLSKYKHIFTDTSNINNTQSNAREPTSSNFNIQNTNNPGKSSTIGNIGNN